MTFARISVALILLSGLAQFALAADSEKKPEKKEVVDFRKLKEVMPEKLVGLKRTECSGEKNKIGEFTMSMAKAKYAPEAEKDAEKDNAPSIHVEIIDYSSAADMAQGFAIWGQMEIDKETDDGYEKTVKIAGNPGLETYSKDSKRGEMHLFVAKRFLVNLQVENLPAEQTKKAAEALPLDKLTKLDAAK